MPSLRGAAKGLMKRLLPGGRAAPGHKGEPGTRKVWRISPSAPAGEWVDPDVPTTQSPAETQPAELSSSGWLTSSMDLLGGSQVIEGEDTEHSPLSDEQKTLPLGTRVPKK